MLLCAVIDHTLISFSVSNNLVHHFHYSGNTDICAHSSMCTTDICAQSEKPLDSKCSLHIYAHYLVAITQPSHVHEHVHNHCRDHTTTVPSRSRVHNHCRDRTTTVPSRSRVHNQLLSSRFARPRCFHSFITTTLLHDA